MEESEDSNLGGFHLAGFQNRYIRPTLSALHHLKNGANGENRTHTPKPERDFKSQARLPIPPHSHNFKNSILSYFLKWTGIIVAFFFICQEF